MITFFITIFCFVNGYLLTWYHLKSKSCGFFAGPILESEWVVPRKLTKSMVVYMALLFGGWVTYKIRTEKGAYGVITPLLYNRKSNYTLVALNRARTVFVKI